MLLRRLVFAGVTALWGIPAAAADCSASLPNAEYLACADKMLAQLPEAADTVVRTVSASLTSLTAGEEKLIAAYGAKGLTCTTLCPPVESMGGAGLPKLTDKQKRQISQALGPGFSAVLSSCLSRPRMAAYVTGCADEQADFYAWYLVLHNADAMAARMPKLVPLQRDLVALTANAPWVTKKPGGLSSEMRALLAATKAAVFADDLEATNTAFYTYVERLLD